MTPSSPPLGPRRPRKGRTSAASAREGSRTRRRWAAT
ncbi:unnamed protein product [Linum tenue]|uniref:Uncharacterized protein n=1 Tax=Linum tenue TaxID=586396 RepID=A0AAV0P4L5_9ROSI|nr:unnamed protein product [Linum tenue]